MLDDATIKAVADGLDARKATHLERQIAEYRSQIDDTTEAIETRRAGITNELRRLAETRDLLQIAKDAGEDRSYVDHLLEEWADLSVHRRLASASFVDGTIALETTDDIRLHREDSDETRWLGRFRMLLDLDSGRIKLHNLDTRRGGRDHPHVVNGSPCFGADHGIFSELMAAGSLNLLYEMLLQYLEKLNLRDEYGAYGSYWFEREDVRPEGASRPEPDHDEVLTVPEFAERYGVGAAFICVRGPFGRDTLGERGIVESYDDGNVNIRWNSGRPENRGTGLEVRLAEAVAA